MTLVLVLLALTGTSTASSEPVALTIGRDVIKPIAPAPMQTHAKVRTPNLATAASLCTDLARVLETKQLPALLERAAKLIDASGILLWIADSGGKELRPVIAFGYSDQALARMGAISRDASNAVAAVYRSAEPRTLEGDGSKNGAVVAPLITSDGCVGVFSAEMKGGSEKDPNSQALASILAAQLATLVCPSTAALPRAAEA